MATPWIVENDMPEQATPHIKQVVVIFWHAPYILATYLPTAFRGVVVSLLLRVGPVSPAQKRRVEQETVLPESHVEFSLPETYNYIGHGLASGGLSNVPRSLG